MLAIVSSYEGPSSSSSSQNWWPASSASDSPCRGVYVLVSRPPNEVLELDLLGFGTRFAGGSDRMHGRLACQIPAISEY